MINIMSGWDIIHQCFHLSDVEAFAKDLFQLALEQSKSLTVESIHGEIIYTRWLNVHCRALDVCQ